MDAKGFIGGFIVLGFAIFLIGLLTGMLAIEILQVESDFSMLWVMVFSVGFLSGAVVSVIVLIIIRLIRSRRKPS
jgi:hypothetical protein